MSRNSNWNERELTLALALYYRVPATKISGTNPMLKDASAYIGRSSSAIAFKLANFRAIDRNAGEGPRGFSHGSRTDTEVMERFLDPDSGSVDWKNYRMPFNQFLVPFVLLLIKVMP